LVVYVDSHEQFCTTCLLLKRLLVVFVTLHTVPLFGFPCGCVLWLRLRWVCCVMFGLFLCYAFGLTFWHGWFFCVARRLFTLFVRLVYVYIYGCGYGYGCCILVCRLVVYVNALTLVTVAVGYGCASNARHWFEKILRSWIRLCWLAWLLVWI